MLLASEISPAVCSLKTVNPVELEEMHHWKLLEEEESGRSPLFGGTGHRQEVEEKEKNKCQKQAQFVYAELADSYKSLKPHRRLQRKKLVFF